MTGRELQWKTEDGEKAVRIEESGSHGTIHIDDQSFPFVVHDRSVNGGWIEVNGRNVRFYVNRNRNGVSVWVDGHTYRLRRVQKGAVDDGPAAGSSGEVRALMPGKVLRIDVRVGDTVTEKQPIVVMESMKMENALVATRSGTVTKIECEVGQVVQIGDLLVEME